MFFDIFAAKIKALCYGKHEILHLACTDDADGMRSELKAINELYPEWQDETGVRIIIVSIDDAQNAQKVKPMVDGMGWEYDVLLDPNGDFKRAMNVQSVPHVFVLDGKGNIVHNHSGYTDGAETELYDIIKNL